MKIYYRVPENCTRSWMEIEVDYPTCTEGYQDFIAHDAAEDYAEDAENLTDWAGGNSDPLTFEFSLTEGGPILFSRKIYAEYDIAFTVLDADSE